MKLRNLTLATLALVPSPAYADSIYFCEACQPGTYGDGKSCTDCPTGKYTSSAGSSSCYSCNADKFVSRNGNCGSVTDTYEGYCRETKSTSATDHSKRYTKTVNLGNTCTGHTYCSAQTNGTCTSCSSPANSTWTSSSGCGWHCKAGYGYSNGSCPACATGYYKSGAGNTSCSQCPAGKYSNAGANATASTGCNVCGAGTYSNAGAGSCSACPAGKYSTGGASSCTNCLTTGVASCSATTGKATSCKAGYGFNSSNGTCTECGIGYYSAGGTNTCTTCHEPTINDSSNWFTYWYAKATDETIDSCYANSTKYSNKLEADNYYTKCVYDANYKKSAEVKMTLNKWKIAVARTASSQCRDNCYASANAFNDKYFNCLKGCESPVEQEMTCGPIYGKKKTTYCTKKGSSSSTANPETTDIKENIGGCPAGQTCLNGRCEPCPYGQYKSGTGWEACTKKSTNIKNGGSCSRQCHFIEFHKSGCCWMDLWATCGALAAAGAVLDAPTFLALSTTPVGICLIASGNLNYWPRTCEGTSSTIYGINEGKTAQTALSQCK